jgi:N-acetyl-alpha-D-glucosaminyl L-malate synthase BshA
MSAPLRIGITCYPTFGGSGIIATEIGTSLARRGHRVHFICSDVPSRLDRFVDNVFFHAVESHDYPLFEHSPYPLVLASKMVEVATYEKLDLLHVHYAIPHATSAILAKQILGAEAPPVITTLHGTDITLVGNDPGFLPITRFSILKSDRVTVPSAYLREATYRNLDVPRELPIELIPNFVDTELYAPAVEKRWEPIAPLFSLSGAQLGVRPKVLIHNSNFRPLKRVDDVLAVFARVRAAMSAVLVLVGDGPERSRIERLARELGLLGAVCFLGNQLNFVEVLKHADLFLLPSQLESFGLAALEALSAGVPVIASRAGGIPEVIEDGVNGLLFDVGDVAGVAAGALRILGEPDLAARMGEAARARALERHQKEPLVSRYEDAYRELCKRSAQRAQPA